MRNEVVGAVRALADPDYQKAVWIRREFPHPEYYDDFSLNIHILYDDSGVCEDPFGSIGSYLRSEREAEVVSQLADALNALLAVEGEDRSDSEYLGSPHWQAVVHAASTAYDVLTLDSAV
ncbi:hypothetical protein [Nonomuraea sp. NPDC005650]|uniref:SCO4402 family protein n=1 Tax=Nonomuraea sp. NPDC005650 TaxID=3157045 RepID=UPI0033AE0C5A